CRKAAGQSLSTPTLIEVQRVISIDIYMKKIILPFLFISAKNNATLIPLSNGQRDLVGHIAKMSGGGKTALQKALERLFDLVSTIGKSAAPIAIISASCVPLEARGTARLRGIAREWRDRDYVTLWQGRA